MISPVGKVLVQEENLSAWTVKSKGRRKRALQEEEVVFYHRVPFFYGVLLEWFSTFPIFLFLEEGGLACKMLL